MNALQTAVVVLLVAFGLGGCATEMIKIDDTWVRHAKENIDPNRPLPQQPLIPSHVKSDIAAQSIRNIPVYIGKFAYYDLGWLTGWVPNKNGEEPNFTIMSPKLNNPTTKVIAASNSFLGVLKKHLRDNGFNVVDRRCEKCLRLDVDFATATLDPDGWRPIIVIATRTRVSHGDTEVLKTRDDKPAWARKALIGSHESALGIAEHLAAINTTNELIQAWDIAIKGGKATKIPKKFQME